MNSEVVILDRLADGSRTKWSLTAHSASTEERAVYCLDREFRQLETNVSKDNVV